MNLRKVNTSFYFITCRVLVYYCNSSTLIYLTIKLWLKINAKTSINDQAMNYWNYKIGVLYADII